MTDPDLPATRWVRIGTVGSPWGVKGANKITSDTDPLRQIFKYKSWVLDALDRPQPIQFREVHAAGATLAAILEGSLNPETAAQLTGRAIFVERQQLANPDDGYYYVDLEGCEVHNLSGESLGRVVKVFNNGANDVLETQGERTRLLPFVLDQYVKHVDIAAKRILIDWDADF